MAILNGKKKEKIATIHRKFLILNTKGNSKITNFKIQRVCSFPMSEGTLANLEKAKNMGKANSNIIKDINTLATMKIISRKAQE
jgi:hypothetical protein